MDTPQSICKQTYDDVADWYLQWIETSVTGRSPRERYALRVLAGAPAHSPQILELGCGPGVPVTRLLLDRGAHVVANDISPRLLAMAQERCPQAALLPGDMNALSFDAARFDGILSFYAIFHLPRAEQREMLDKIHGWLKPGGLFALNLATMDEEEIHGEFLGRGMFWSSYDVQQSKSVIVDAGFTIVEAEELEAGDGKLDEGDPDYGVKFLWLLVQKSG